MMTASTQPIHGQLGTSDSKASIFGVISLRSPCNADRDLQECLAGLFPGWSHRDASGLPSCVEASAAFA